jgi:hypothetical protein
MSYGQTLGADFVDSTHIRLENGIVLTVNPASLEFGVSIRLQMDT